MLIDDVLVKLEFLIVPRVAQAIRNVIDDGGDVFVLGELGQQRFDARLDLRFVIEPNAAQDRVALRLNRLGAGGEVLHHVLMNLARVLEVAFLAAVLSGVG